MTWTFSHDYVLSAPIDRIVTVGPTAVVAQIEHELVRLELDSRRTASLAAVAPGSQLLAVGGNDERLLFDNAGKVVRTDARGATLREVALGDDVELMDARVSGGRLVMLVAESVGAASELGVPRFTFVAVDHAMSATWLTADWPKVPADWVLDSGRGQLIVYAHDAIEAAAFDLGTGERSPAAAAYSQKVGRWVRTGTAAGPHSRIAIALWEPDDRRGEIRIAAVDEHRNKVAVILSRADGVPKRPLWSADGNSLAIRTAAEERPAATVASIDREGRWVSQTVTQIEPDGALTWCGNRLVVQTDERVCAIYQRSTN